MEVRMHPGAVLAALVHDDLMGLPPIILGSPPQPRECGRKPRRRLWLRQALLEFGERHRLYHHACGVNRPAACSITSAAENSVSSSNGRPMSCNPSGSPPADKPAGTEI